MALSSAKIIKKIGCDKLELVRGKGYWYFIYDDLKNGKYDTHSVYTMYLGQDKDLDFWIAEGKELVERMEK